MQRLRITFSRGEEIKYITHLDLMRLWQRALHRADLPLSFTQGFSPHLRISLAAPLAVGVTSGSELMDIFIERRVSPHFFLKNTEHTLPEGIKILEIADIGLGEPSLQSQTRFAEYKVTVEADRSAQDIEAAVESLLARESLPWQHTRDREIHKYDLRPLVSDIKMLDWQPRECTLEMRLRCDSSGTGRPEQVTAALEFPQHPRSIHRTKLILDRRA